MTQDFVAALAAIDRLSDSADDTDTILKGHWPAIREALRMARDAGAGDDVDFVESILYRYKDLDIRKQAQGVVDHIKWWTNILHRAAQRSEPVEVTVEQLADNHAMRHGHDKYSQAWLMISLEAEYMMKEHPHGLKIVEGKAGG